MSPGQEKHLPHKALGAGASSVGVGPTNPVGIGPNTVYKQWTKQRGQLANNKLKISTFFPNSVPGVCLIFDCKSQNGHPHQYGDGH